MDHIKRLQNVEKLLSDIPCDVLLIEDPLSIYYLTGLELSAGKLVVTHQRRYLLVDGRYFEKCQKNPFCEVILLTSHALNDLLCMPRLEFVHTLGFDSKATSYQNFLDLEHWLKELSDRGKSIDLLPIDNPVMSLRKIKDADEMNLLRRAAKINYQGFEHVCSILKEGITEEEAAVELEIFWKNKGGRKVSFDPIIAFGANCSMPHYRAGSTVLQSGMPVLIDIGVELHHYHSDMTRTIFFGKVDRVIQEIYDIVAHAKESALKLCKPGTRIGDLDSAARDVIKKYGYGEFFTHSLGHGIGLEVHEEPFLRNRSPENDQVLEPGMCITIEPGIYLPEVGGVRLEDTIVITQDGFENLTEP